MTDVPDSIATAAAALRAGSRSAIELLDAVCARADRHDERIGSFLSRHHEEAKRAAAEADRELAAGVDRGPLHGIPLAIKDIIASAEGPTTAQSLVSDRSWFAGRDAVCVTRLRRAGAVIVGKVSTMEYAIGFPDPSKPFPIPRNPFDPSRWAGGSSSGTGNGVAAGFFLGGLGTDTGGSIRIPAAFCGITGLKPTFGRVPKSGCLPLGYTLDHIGPMARTARDCALMLEVLAGHDASDPYAAAVPTAVYTDALRGDVDGLRIGVFRCHERAGQDVHPELGAVFDAAVGELAAAGATLVEATVPLFAELTDAAFIGMLSEAFAYHHANLRTRWDDYGYGIRHALATAALYDGADYVDAQRVRRVGLARIAEVFRTVDLLVLPTALGPAPPLAGPRAVTAAFTSQPSTLPTPAFDALGLPALSVPMGFTADGLPLGLQIVGRPWDEATVLRAGDAFQRRTAWHAPLDAPRPASASPAAPVLPAVQPANDAQAERTVQAALAAAGLPATDAELAALVRAYPAVRAAADRMAAAAGRDAEPVLGFRPDAGWDTAG